MDGRLQHSAAALAAGHFHISCLDLRTALTRPLRYGFPTDGGRRKVQRPSLARPEGFEEQVS